MAVVSGPVAPKIIDRAPSPGRRSRPPAPERRLTEIEFRSLLADGTAEDIADVLLTLEEPGRRALAALLPAHTTPESEPALLVAGAGCLAGPDRLVAWLRSRRFHRPPAEETLLALVRVMSAPGRPRLTTVAGALARRLQSRAAWPGEWAVAEALLLAAGIPPPVTDAVTRRWIRSRAAGGPSPAARLADDPWLDRLLPRLFFPPAGMAIDREWASALAGLVADERLSRAALIRLALRRMSDPARAG